MNAEINTLSHTQRTDNQPDRRQDLPVSSLTILFNSIAEKVVEPLKRRKRSLLTSKIIPKEKEKHTLLSTISNPGHFDLLYRENI
jgi:hypothetical protein